MGIHDTLLTQFFGLNETYKLFSGVNLNFTQCPAEGNLYAIVEYNYDTNRKRKIMINVNENSWCEFDNKRYDVHQDSNGLYLMLGKNFKNNLPEKLYIFETSSIQGELLSIRKKSFYSKDLSMKDLIEITPHKKTPSYRRESYDSANPEEIRNSRIQNSPARSPVRTLTKQKLFASNQNIRRSFPVLPFINEQQQTTPRPIQHRAPSTGATDTSFLFEENFKSYPGTLVALLVF